MFVIGVLFSVMAVGSGSFNMTRIKDRRRAAILVAVLSLIALLHLLEHAATVARLPQVLVEEIDASAA